MPKAFDTYQEAAQGALKDAIGRSDVYEYAGVVYRWKDKFYYTEPETSKKTHNVNVKVRYPKGSKLIGLYHSHPEGEHSEYFSEGDIEIAEKLGVPYFMGNVKDGSMRVFDPEQSTVAKMRIGDGRLRRRVRYSAGSPLELPQLAKKENPLDPQPTETAADAVAPPTFASAGFTGAGGT